MRTGMPTSRKPAMLATRHANRSRTTATAKVAREDGTNTGLPETPGIAPDSPDEGETAIRTCHRARAMNTRLTVNARAVSVFMGSNVRHERRRKGREAAFGTAARWRG